MYPWLRVMYAVVVIGSRIRRSACGMNLSTFWPCAQANGALSVTAMAMTMAPRTRLLERRGGEFVCITKSPGTNMDDYGASCAGVAAGTDSILDLLGTAYRPWESTWS